MVWSIVMSIRPNSAVDATSPYNKLAVSVRMNSTVLSVLSIALALAISTAVMSAHAHVRLDAGWGGPFWHLPLMVWLAVAGLAILCLFIESALPRAACIFLFGFATMGVLGYLEPFGVFHDSWQNVGLGQLAVSEGQGGQIWNVPYVASSPGSFLLYG